MRRRRRTSAADHARRGRAHPARYILEGELTFALGDGEEIVVAGPGTFVLAPPGVRHGFTNHESTPVRMFNLHPPAGFDLRIAADD